MRVSWLSVLQKREQTFHRAIKDLVTKDGYSMNQFLITAAAEKLSAIKTVDCIRQRAERANLKDFDRLLSLVPDSEPDHGDELPVKSKRRGKRRS